MALLAVIPVWRNKTCSSKVLEGKWPPETTVTL